MKLIKRTIAFFGAFITNSAYIYAGGPPPPGIGDKPAVSIDNSLWLLWLGGIILAFIFFKKKSKAPRFKQNSLNSYENQLK